MYLEVGLMPFLKENFDIAFFMFHGGLVACVDMIIEDLEF